ncbi:3-hydroxyacyl-CoA dehydrogenase [Ahniella affigens]|uniref:3-hydroxyacyl-CoA dehydrogenase n=1 Tax=Ahniella affigens TaxID=2021234 RepID=A0A2P1PM36_9GAMM|nr:3-hydroxyacyl-CoA dehydrogenase/enoyl-CoA hydratase family protein [Ahniella affigens]AVP95905.1 3-hydroxyacyl-CoA dehydrogenase [Ahniella affigens]
MSDINLRVRRVAVLGAGVMGAQIAAHLANASVEVILFDLPAKEGDPNGVVQKALANLSKLSPSPLATKGKAAEIQAANYEQHLPLLKHCDLVIEAIAERMDWKHDLYRKIVPHLRDDVVLATNTSGLSINALAEALPPERHERFLGVHFFNPPRYMHLCELIPIRRTDPRIVEELEAFLTTVLGKGVVRAKDTPNFIGNRIGVFSMLSVMHHTKRFSLSFDVVDALTGPAIGRPKSATYRTADVVGLDTMAHVIKTMADTLPNDPWKEFFVAPDWLKGLIEKGALGQKAKAGIYMKQDKDILVLDLATQTYKPQTGKVSPDVEAALRIKNPAERFQALRASADPQAQFLWACFRDLFHYTAYHLEEIADNARDVDFAIRWGYGWMHGPFETWQAAGWKTIAAAITAEIAAGETMVDAPLPKWVTDGNRAGVHAAHGSFAPRDNTFRSRSKAPVYKRQLFPDPLIGELPHPGETVFETPDARCWHQGDDIAILSFKTKMNTVSAGVLDAVNRAVDEAERRFKGLVIWQHGEPFSAGADLTGAMAALQANKIADLEAMVDRFQQTSMRIKYSLVPVVAAVRGMALGGGCEFQMHSARTVAALESYIGLVEAGVGLLPAGGGLKELALRANAAAQASSSGDVFPFLQKVFQTVAMATVSGSALEAKELGLLRQSDVVVFNPHELLYVAKSEAKALAETGYRPPATARAVPVAGDVGTATLKMMLVNMLEGRFVSPHDMEIGSRIADTLCGGDIERGQTVDEQWFLDLELKHFVALAQMAKTQERIQHTLTTGKPLRN